LQYLPSPATLTGAGFEVQKRIDFMNTEYRNEGNRTYNDGKFFVSRYDLGKCLFIGTYEECEKYINENKDGDFDEYGIFDN